MFWVPLLLLAWSAAGAACASLCLAAVRTAGADTDPAHELTLYEAAFLSGGPVRVADLALLSMARQRRLLLAHTGWATVVDPHGRDDIERSVIGAIGPRGQSPIAPVRAAAATTDAVRGLADRLVRAGLAVPAGARTTVAAGVRQVRAAATAVVVLGVTALLLPGEPGLERYLIACWFALPLVLSLGCLALARIEAHPCSRWASPAGQRLLAALPRHRGDHTDDRAYLTAVAVHGVRAVGEPELRAAFDRRH
ncbi:TIGR04222 domain-containing membrane protein [Streptomyces sp. JB150]|uniref:TIGR04222 domain-containing membrane protein n=1 Tax=Streptomyces sp. JB150 TaxID=2714844 RepID=UPI0014076752|nr:TIGR04222 domain-containing membrane protein [Streptomyces sp. JB150]QIJ65297.1 TIGR04222 domain-containing membrane protein [Streptomyces sp. JB150]